MVQVDTGGRQHPFRETEVEGQETFLPIITWMTFRAVGPTVV